MSDLQYLLDDLVEAARLCGDYEALEYYPEEVKERAKAAIAARDAVIARVHHGAIVEARSESRATIRLVASGRMLSVPLTSLLTVGERADW